MWFKTAAVMCVLAGVLSATWYDPELSVKINAMRLAVEISDQVTGKFWRVGHSDTETLEAVRARWKTYPIFNPDLSAFDVEEAALEGRGNASVLIIKPKRLKSHTDGLLPLIVFFHGGCMAFGNAREVWAPQMSDSLNAVVVSAEYRLAPEYKYPTQWDDAWAAVQFALRNAEWLGADPGNLSVVGPSGGGTLAASVAKRAAIEGSPNIRLQVLIAPWLEVPMAQHASYLFDTNMLAVNIWGTQGMLGLKGGLACIADQLCQVTTGPVHKDLAPAIVLVGTRDVLHDEGVEYHEALRAAGIPSTLIITPANHLAIVTQMENTGLPRILEAMDRIIHPQDNVGNV